MLLHALESGEQSMSCENIEKQDGIEMAIHELISKVDESQSLIDELEGQIQELRSQIQSKVDAEYAPKLQALQEQLDFYYALSCKQSEIIRASEILQARTFALLAGS